jgi:hypothetical protein
VVVHAYNPSFSEGRGRRITRSRLAWANLGRPCLNNKIQNKKVWGHGLSSRERPWVQFLVLQKKKERKKERFLTKEQSKGFESN